MCVCVCVVVVVMKTMYSEWDIWLCGEIVFNKDTQICVLLLDWLKMESTSSSVYTIRYTVIRTTRRSAERKLFVIAVQASGVVVSAILTV